MAWRKRHSYSEEGSSYIPLVRYLLIFLVAISGRKVAWKPSTLKLFGTTGVDELYPRGVIVMTSPPKYGIVQMSLTVEGKCREAGGRDVA